MKFYVRIICGLILSMSSLAMATAEGAVVRQFAARTYFDFSEFKQGNTHLNLFEPTEGWSWPAEKNIPAEFWQGRDAHSFFDGDWINSDWPTAEHLADWPGLAVIWESLELPEREHLESLIAQFEAGDWAFWHEGAADHGWQDLEQWLADRQLDYEQGNWPQPDIAHAAAVPVPAAVWLMLSGLGFLFTRAVARRKPLS